MNISYNVAEKNLKALIDDVNTDIDHVIITAGNHHTVLMSEANYNSLMETLYLQSTPANTKHLLQSIEDVERGCN